MKRLALVALALSACTSNSQPDAQSEAAFFDQMNTMQTVQSHALATANFAPATGSVNLTASCATSGSITLVGNYNTSDNGGTSTYDLKDTLSSCTGLGYTIDGEWDWSGNYSPTAFHYAITGNTTFTSGADTYTFVESLTVDFAPGTFSMSGSVTINGDQFSDFGSWTYSH